MNKDSLLETLNSNKAKLTLEDIRTIMDEELNKDPNEMDTDLVDMCMDALEEAASKAQTDENTEIIKPSGEGSKKVFKLTRALLIAAIVTVFFSIAIPVSAGYFNANRIDTPDSIIDSALYAAVQKTQSSVFSSTIWTSRTDGIDIEFSWSISNGSVRIDSDRYDLPSGIYVDTLDGNTSEVVLIYTEYLGGGGSYSSEYYDYYFYVCDLTKNKIISLFDKPLNTYLHVESAQVAPDHNGIVISNCYNGSTIGEAYYFDGKDLIDISELIGIKNDFTNIAISASIYENYIVVLEDDHSNMYEPKQNVYFIDLADLSVINGASDVPRYLYYHQPNGIIPSGGIYAYRYNEEDKIDIVDLRDGSIIPTLARGSIEKEASTFFYNRFMLYFDKSGMVQIIDLENGNILSTIKTGFEFSGEWRYNLTDNDELCYLLITTDSNETYSYALDSDASSLLLEEKKIDLFDRTVNGSWYSDGKFYEFHNGAFQEAETNSFSASVEVNGKKQKIEFIWSVTNEKLRYACYKNDLPNGFSLNEIEGNDSALLLSYIEGGKAYEYFICDLSKNTITPLFEDVFAGYLPNNVKVSPDLKTAIFSKNNIVTYYYDGKKVYDLFDLFGLSVDEERIVSTDFLGKYILVDVGPNEDTIIGIDLYVIDTSDMSWEMILTTDFPRYDEEFPQPEALHYIGGGYYGNWYYYGNYYGNPSYSRNPVVSVRSIFDPEQFPFVGDSYFEIETGEVPNWNQSEYFDGYLAIDDGERTVRIIDPETGKIVYRINTGLNLNDSWNYQIVKDGDDYYLLASKTSDQYQPYKFSVPTK